MTVINFKSSQPPDYAARLRALDINSSFIIEAPAGSGKTGLLMQRYLRLLAESDIDAPEQVLAITFTRKAAAEMHHRILTALQHAAQNAPLTTENEFERTTRAIAEKVLSRSNEHGWEILQQPQRLNITTIDSLCAQITRRLPLNAGGGDLQPLNDPTPLYLEAAQQTLRMLGKGDERQDAALRTLLLHRNGRFSECANLLAEMLRWRDQWLRHIPWTEDAVLLWRQHLENYLQSIVENHLLGLNSLFEARLLQRICEMAHIAANNLQQSGKQDKLAGWMRDATPPTKDRASLIKWLGFSNLLLTTKSEWRKSFNVGDGFPPGSKEKVVMLELMSQLKSGDDAEALRTALEKLNSLPPSGFDEQQWKMARALFQILPLACANLNVLFNERGQCDFTAISIAAVHALQKDDGCNELAMAMGTRIQHLLVDEMQDTSVTHYDLLKAITDSWDGRSQTVTLVGDPKQSIYLFREARVELFENALQHGLGQQHLEALRLTANFRSNSELVDAFNSDFTNIFGSTSVAATAVRSAHGTRTWHISTMPSKTDSMRAEYVAEQAKEIAGMIHALLADAAKKSAAPPTIAILVRNRKHAAPVLAELRKLGVAYSAGEIESLNEQPEVQDIVALTRALLHPGDRVAWLSILRAPWCGLTLESLLQLTASADNTAPISQLIRERMQSLEAKERARLVRTWKILIAAIELTGRVPLAEIVERTWISLGGAGLAASYSRQDKSAQAVLENIESYLSMLDVLAAENTAISAELIQSRLEKRYSDFLHENVAVEVLTIHKAKGLEWDHVFVPSLHSTGQHDQKRLMEWYEMPSHQASIALLAPVPSRSAEKTSQANQLTNWIRRYRRQKKYEELKRLLYVASTRARQHLHLFAVTEETENYRPMKDSLLHASWAASSSQHPGDAFAAEEAGLQIAAEAAPEMTVRRLCDGVEPFEEFLRALGDGHADMRVTGDAKVTPGRTPQPARPESSLAARALGNVVHRWMQILSEEFSSGANPADLRMRVSNAGKTIEAQLRHEGAPAKELRRLTERATLALQNALQDATGLWLLSSRTNARNEYALSVLREDRAVQLRMDRIFHAGDVTLSEAGDAVWIVDYKTSEPMQESTEEFLAREREVYRRQLENYADAVRLQRGDAAPVNLALYYPLLPAIDSWKY